MTLSWRNIIGLWLLGCLAAAQLTKLASLAPLLRAQLELTLGQTGLLISLIEVSGATLGLVSGLAIARLGALVLLRAGIALLAAGGLALAVVEGTGALYAARFLESLGYLLLVVAAPTLIAQHTDATKRQGALALWSTFFAVGTTGGIVLTGYVQSAFGLSAALMIWPAIVALSYFTSGPLKAGRQGGGFPIAMPPRAGWAMTIAFGFYTALIAAVLSLFPSFLVEQVGMAVKAASWITGGISLSSVLGFFCALAIIRRFGADAPLSGRVRAIMLTLSIGFAIPIFWGFDGIATLIVPVACAGLVVALTGVASPLIFARLPDYAGRDHLAPARMATINGLLTQFGAGGALVGPFIAGWVVDLHGWHALSIACGTLAVLMTAGFMGADHLSHTALKTREKVPVQ